MYKLGEKKEQKMMTRDMKRNSELGTLFSSEISEASPPLLNLQHHSTKGRVSPSPSNSFTNGNKNVNENKLVDDGFGLCENLYQMHIRDDERDGDTSGQMRKFERDPDGFAFNFGDVSSYYAEKYGSYDGFNKGFQSSPQQVSMCLDGGDVFRSTFLGLQGTGYEKGDSFGSYSIGYNQSNDLSSVPSWHDNQRNYLLEQRMEQGRGLDNRGMLLQGAFTTRPYIGNPFVCSQQCGIDGNGRRAAIDSLSSPGFLHSKIPLEENVMEDHSVIIQGRGLKYDIDNKGFDSFKCCKKKTLKEFGLQNLQEKNSKLDKRHGENVTLMPSPYSLVEFQGCIYYMAKDQKGCRFLQRIFDEGGCLDVQIIFTEVIDNIVELMMDPFGNYLVQKLLDVCNEDQRLQIILTVTKETGQLIIFDAAAKFCVDIATHRHGCCVLQRCIAHSNGPHRDKLITQISRNGLLLAQDPFGNYVVQYIIELKVNSGNLLYQFKGHYVHLSMQKFSSHVVEKCLKHFAESRSQIIRELTSVVHFEQLLQDPFANYVIQSALVVTKGPLHASLVDAVRPHTILRTSPYCKRIFSRNLLKK
ncbi:hypothetical protein GOBAR_AA06610 [Gossypium barbadense]|uniref:PUM-HD domain-containing protein n=1 Tax=Gossypium barbadense TaxID=3634 RepID=A0A2P5YEF5_GOSBA|nr:hypothetical protein GOBAR_AA06610 [Gossypium barbadense]